MSPPDDGPPRPEELPALVGDIAHEVNQFFHSARRSFELGEQAAHIAAERNAHVEAMLIHARCLVDFFSCRPKLDDVIAIHYIAD